MVLYICKEYNAILTCVDILNKFCRLILCFVGERALSASCFRSILSHHPLPGCVEEELGGT